MAELSNEEETDGKQPLSEPPIPLHPIESTLQSKEDIEDKFADADTKQILRIDYLDVRQLTSEPIDGRLSPQPEPVATAHNTLQVQFGYW